MDLPLEVLDIKLIATRPYIPLLKPITLHYPMDMGYRHVMSDVEFAFFVEQRAVNIELDDESLLRAVIVSALRLEDGVEFVDLVDDSDTVTAVGVFAWLYNPDVAHFPLLLYSHLHLLLLLLYVRLALFVVSQKTFVLWVLDAFFYVEG